VLNISKVESLVDKSYLKTGKKQKTSFRDILSDAIMSVNEQQRNYDTALHRFLLNEEVNVHDLMIAGEKARLSLELTLQIRNKVIEAYQEIMRMQV
jgi:flagellar hook-basal body complex protein FliE